MSATLKRPWCVRLLRHAGVVLAGVFAAVLVLHTAPVRGLVLRWIESVASEAAGLSIQARTLNYNLPQGWVEFSDVTARVPGSPPLLSSKRLTVEVPLLDLIRGDFHAADVVADGTTLLVDYLSAGRWNRSSPTPTTLEAPARSQFFRSLRVRHLAIVWTDRANGLALNLPGGDLDARYVSSQYAVTYTNAAAGRIQSGTLVQPLDRVTLKAAAAPDAVILHQLRVEMGRSFVEVNEGRLGLSRSDIAATVIGDFDARQFFSGLTGRAHAHVSIFGSLSSPAAVVQFTSDDLRAGDVSLREVSLTTRYADKLLTLTQARARAHGSLLTARGTLDHRGPQLSTRLSVAMDGIPVDQLFSASVWKRSHSMPGRATLTFACDGSDWRRGLVSGLFQMSPRDDVAFRARLEGEQLALTIGSHGPGTLGASGTARIGLTSRSVTGTLKGTIGSIRQTGELFSELFANGLVDGSIDWTLDLKGSLTQPRALFSARGDHLSTPLPTHTALDVAGAWDDSGLHTERIRITTPGGGAIFASGTVSGSDLHFEGSLNDVALRQIAGKDGKISGSGSGKFTVRGSTAAPQVEATLKVTDLRAYEQPFGTMVAMIDTDGPHVNIRQLRVEQSEGSSLEGSASIDLNSREFQFQAAGMALRAAHPGARGVVSLTTEGEGTFDNPKIRLDAHATNVASEAFSVGRLDAQMEYSGTHGSVHLQAPDLNAIAHGQLDLTGDYPASITADLSGTSVLLSADSDSRIAALLDGQFSGSGSLRKRELSTGALRLRDLKVEAGGNTISSDGPINVDYEQEYLIVHPAVLKTNSAQLRVSGKLPAKPDAPAGMLAVAGTVRLSEAIRAEGISADGELTFEGGIAGSLMKWEPQLKASVRSARVSRTGLPFALEQFTADARVNGGVLEIDKVGGTLGGGSLRGSLSVPLRLIASQLPHYETGGDEPIRWSLEVAAAGLPLGTKDGAAGLKFSLQTTGEARSLAPADVVGVATLSDLSLYGKGGEMKQSRPSRITLEHATLRLEETELRGPNGFLRISGMSTLTPDPQIEGRVAGDVDASRLSVLDPQLDVGGRVKLDVRTTGNLQALTAEGSVELTGGTLAISGIPVRADELAGRLDLVGKRILLSTLTGRLNGGKFSADGQATLSGGTLKDVTARAEAENIFLEYPAGFRTSSRLNLLLRSGKDRLVLGGRIEIHDGIYREVFDPRVNSAETSISRSVPGSGSLDTSPLGFDLQIVTTQPLEMDNNIGRIAAVANLRLRGTPSHPNISGEVRLEEGGRIYFGDRTYDVERGSVRFDGTQGLEPQQINLVATTRTSDYDIRLNIAGAMAKLTTTFTSDPPLSRNDILSVLVTGKTISENRGVDIGRLEASLLLSGAFNATLGGSMGRRLGVSQVSVQPGVITAESDPATRLTITEDFTRSLRLIYSMNLSDSSDQIWIVEYDLTRKLRSRAVKESDNSYRAEVRHEVRFGTTGGSAAKVPTIKRTLGDITFKGGDPFSEPELTRRLGLKHGQTYSPVKVRAGADRLLRFLQKNGYLEARVVMDREEQDRSVSLVVTVDAGSRVVIHFAGDPLSRSLRKRIHSAWQEGHNDRHRIEVARRIVTGHYGRQGFLRAETACDVNLTGTAKEVSFKLNRGRRYSDVNLVITGASGDHAEEIRALIGKAKLEDALYADPRRVSESVVRYYRRVGHLAADASIPQAIIDEKAGTGKMVLSVSEGPAFQVGKLVFEGNVTLGQDALLSGLPLHEGGPFEPARLTAAVTNLRTRYESQGFRDIQIEYRLTEDAANGLLDVTFNVQEKQQRMVESVSVQGTRHTSEAFVRKQLLVTEGEPESLKKVNDSIQNLSRTGAFASVDIESRGSITGALPNRTSSNLLVLVQEPRPFRVLYGPLYNTNSGFGFIADIENRNSLGNARVLGIRTRYDGDLQEVRLYLTQPVWQSRFLTSTATSYVKRENIAQGIRKSTTGASVQQDWPFHSMYLLSYGYRYERVGLTLLPDDPRTVPLNKSVIAPAFLTASRDTRDSFLDATRGSFIAVGSEYAPGWLGSDYGYFRWSGQYFRYFPLKKPRPVPYGETPLRSRLVFATGARIGLQKGLTDENIVLTDRFFAGGGTTIRGFAQDTVGPQTPGGKPIGGNAMLVLNNELRFPLFWIFDAVAFNDVGNVYPHVSDFSFSDLRKSGGFGLRLRNPFVVLRFDYGIKLDRRPGESFGAFFFSIGQAF